MDLQKKIHTSKQLGLQVHVIKGVDGLVIVRLDLSCMIEGLVSDRVSKRVSREVVKKKNCPGM